MVEESFKEAALSRLLCELIDGEGNTRLVEPYMVFGSSRGKRQFHCFQRSGYSEHNRNYGWKNIDVSGITSINITEKQFSQQPDYNPMNERNFPVVFFAAPKVGGASS